MLHQAGIGAMFLTAKPKRHPLWYSEYMPLGYLMSSIRGRLAMVIFEGTTLQSRKLSGSRTDAGFALRRGAGSSRSRTAMPYSTPANRTEPP
jgi:Ni/Fe-hydrogenase subunit HybB-like protein